MNRESELKFWLNEVFPHTPYRILPLAGDASFRRYYRMISGGERYIIMDAPPPEEPSRFVRIAQLLSHNGLCVPEIRYQNLQLGFLLLSDFGDDLYLNALNEKTVDALYGDAMQALFKMQATPRQGLAHFDSTLLAKEMGLFSEWFVEKHVKVPFNQSMQKIVLPIYETLCDIFSLQPQVFVHRDYHSRNLMILSKGGPGILDFQDAVVGPITYDLVSLLQDCYIRWPRENIESWIQDYYQLLLEKKMLTDKIHLAEFIRWFDLTGLQRHLKNLGIFARLHYRDGKAHYLKDMPRVLKNIIDTCDRYLFLRPLKNVLMDMVKTDTVQWESLCER